MGDEGADVVCVADPTEMLLMEIVKTLFSPDVR
jgi:hypothetical protein